MWETVRVHYPGVSEVGLQWVCSVITMGVNLHRDHDGSAVGGLLWERDCNVVTMGLQCDHYGSGTAT